MAMKKKNPHELSETAGDQCDELIRA